MPATGDWAWALWLWQHSISHFLLGHPVHLIFLIDRSSLSNKPTGPFFLLPIINKAKIFTRSCAYVCQNFANTWISRMLTLGKSLPFFMLEVLLGPKMMNVAPITWRWSSRSALLLPQTNQISGPPVEQCRNGPAPIHPKIPFFQIKRRPRSKVSLGRTSTEEGDGRDPSSENSRFF